MAVLDFPTSPSTDDLYTGDNGAIYIYDTNRWKLLSASPTIGQTEIVEVFVADGTWTKPAGLIHAVVEIVGGGGAGGGAPGTGSSSGSGGGGGGGGGYARVIIPAGDLGDTETVTLGDGGTAVSGLAGNDGGTSTFTRTTGTNLTATGGTGGVVTSGTSDFTSNIVAGGLGAGGDINLNGSDGANAVVEAVQATERGLGGAGGASHLSGSRGQNMTSGASTSGNAGYAYGGGGSGGSAGASASAGLGGVGADGVIIVTSIVSKIVDGTAVQTTTQVFTASGTWTKPAGLIDATIEVVGGGGAGGGGGGYTKATLLASALSATETVTVGAGGTGVSGTTGGAGGTSTFTLPGTDLTATGGAGGFSSIGQQWLGATNMPDGGLGAGGDINSLGQPGERGYHAGTSAQATAVGMGAGGGSSVLGGGGRGSGTSGAGAAGSAPTGGFGGGGGGASSGVSQAAQTGGDGADGVIIVTCRSAAAVSAATSGPLRQVVIATSTTDDSTASTSAVDSSLSASITPLFSDSVIVVTVSAYVAAFYNSSTSTAVRYGTYEIYRSTGTPAILQDALVGRILIGASTVGALSGDALHLMATEEPGSGTHTYKLRHFSGSASVLSQILGSSGTQAVMKIEEFAP